MNQTVSLSTQPANQSTTPDPASARIAFVQSCWNQEIVDQCRLAFVEAVGEQGIAEAQIDVYTVPGGLEIPLQAKLLSKTGRYQIVVAAGLIVDGGIYRHEFVADAIIKAFMDIQLETEVPIISAVLTPHHFHESEEHHRFFFDHFRVKGREVANACVKTLENLHRVQTLAGQSELAG